MKKILAFLTIWALILVFSGCGKKAEVRPSLEGQKAKEAFRLAEQLKRAYLGRDKGLFEPLTTREGYLKVVGSLRDFDSATLEFEPRWVEIEQDRVVLYIHWRGTWLKGGRSYSDEGLSAFILKGNPLKLDDILRANPFSRPEL